ncbi:MAG: hypothetical protein WAZ34_08910 [Rhodocyclaceae bacterium]
MYSAAIAIVMACPLLVVAWLILEKRQHKASVWVGLAAALSAAPFFVGLGVFLGQFENNICFSEAMAELADVPAYYGRTGNAEALSSFAVLAAKLPLQGYETNCREVRAAIQSLKLQPQSRRTQ